jgi:hypothetical protein
MEPEVMPEPFFADMRRYFTQVAEVLRGDADAASLFHNSTDKGMARERVYAQFLKDHLPSGCNVLFGGNVFNQNGELSKQMDIIVTNDVCPQFNHQNRDGAGKAVACVDGTLAVVSVKSVLNRGEVFEALSNLASIPQHRATWGAGDVETSAHVDQWPYKVLFAFSGASAETVKQAMKDYSTEFGNCPRNRQPDMVHVLSKYRLSKFWRNMMHEGHTIPAGRYVTMPVDCDVAAMATLIATIQQILLASRCLPYHYGNMFERMFGVQSPDESVGP